MRTLAVVEYVSLDGVVQAPGHAGEDPEGGFVHGGWTGPFMGDHRRYNSQLFPTAGAFLFGRRTYEIFAEYWPTVTDETDRIAGALNSRPKYVASTTLRDPTWAGTTVLTGDVAEQVTKLKQELGDPLLLFDHHDRHRGPVELRFVDSTVTGGGLVILTYERT
jgi:dihydrofolate reductase